MAADGSLDRVENPLLVGAWVLTLLLNGAADFFFYRMKDVRFAVHFDFRGQANGFMYGDQSAYFMAGLLLVINAALYGSRSLKTGPDSLEKVRVPNREYWLSTPEARLDLSVRLRDFFAVIGIWVNGVFSLTQLFIYTVSRHKDLDPRMALCFVAGVGLMVIPLLAATSWMFKAPEQRI
jgi:hypothetical protein